MFSAIILSVILLYLTFCLLRGQWSGVSVQRDGLKSFSIVIAVKNEEKNLPSLLKSIDNIKYDGDFEVIFVNDHSSDNSASILKDYCTQHPHCLLINQAPNNKGKTQALNTGIEHSQYGIIAYTDADCTIPVDWLTEINSSLLTTHSTLLIGYSPEIFINSFQYFKQLVAAINYAASAYAGVPFSCSGRNLVFSKKAFYEVGGYEGFTQYKAGEDKLLLQRFHQHKKKIGYLPYPPVWTEPADKHTIKNQNLRRYSLFSITRLFWQIALLFIGSLFFLMPLEFIYIQHDIHFSLYICAYLLAITAYTASGCVIHRERYRPIYFVFALILPYYLAFQMIYSPFRKWIWKT